VILEVTSKSRELDGEKFLDDFVRVCWCSGMGVFCMDKVVALYGVLRLLAFAYARVPEIGCCSSSSYPVSIFQLLIFCS